MARYAPAARYARHAAKQRYAAIAPSGRRHTAQKGTRSRVVACARAMAAVTRIRTVYVSIRRAARERAPYAIVRYIYILQQHNKRGTSNGQKDIAREPSAAMVL